MTTPDPAAAPAAAPADVSARLDRLEGMITGLGARLHPAAQAHTEARLERPNLIEHQVEAALRQAEEDRKRREADSATAGAITDLKNQVKELRETKPAQAAVRPITKAFWG